MELLFIEDGQKADRNMMQEKIELNPNRSISPNDRIELKNVTGGKKNKKRRLFVCRCKRISVILHINDNKSEEQKLQGTI